MVFHIFFSCSSCGDMKRQIAVVRHGSVASEYHSRYIGRTEVSLSKLGIEQALSIGRQLQTDEFTACFCSPMIRTEETAEIIAKEVDVSVSTDDCLREIDFGNWEGLNFDEVSDAFPEEVNQWVAEGNSFTFPGGESIGSFNRRVAEAATRILKSEHRNVIIVTHGGVFRVMLCALLGLPLKSVNAFHIGYGATALIQFSQESSSLGQLASLRNREVSSG